MATGCRFRPDCRKICEQPIASAIQLRIGLFQPKPFTSLFANLGGVRLRFFERRNHDADNVALACADATANSSIPDTVARIDEPFFADVLARLPPQPQLEEREGMGYNVGMKPFSSSCHGRGMEQFLTQHGADVTGVISGFDRLRLRASLRWL